MPGKIDSPPNLSLTSIQALRTERQEAAKTSSFWDKWSNLSTGQKWGRALAWLLPPLGLGIQAAANMWQDRQARSAPARPLESKVDLSPESTNGTPLRGSIVFGKTDRDLARGVLEADLNGVPNLVRPGNDLYPASMEGLSEQFAKDIYRKPSHSLQSHDGKNSVGIHTDTPKEKRPAAFRDFFQNEFPGDSGKAEQWAAFASKFLNQNGAAPIPVITGTKYGFAVAKDNPSYIFKMEKGGNSALVEIRAKGPPNALPDIDGEKSTVDNFLLMRIAPGPPEGLEVLSAYSKHNLVPLGQQSQEGAGVDGFPLLEPDPQAPEVDRGGQANPDFAAFRKAYSELESPKEKQSLVGDLAGAVKDKEFLQFMELSRENDEPDPGLARQIQSEVRLQADYPLGTQNVLSPEKGPVAKSGRDWDIQNFVHRKFEEEVAQKHLGIGPEDFYATIKEGMGPVAVMTSRYLSEKELPPQLETLRSRLLESFDQATTLDDFYSRAGKAIDQAKLESA